MQKLKQACINHNTTHDTQHPQQQKDQDKQLKNTQSFYKTI